MDSILLGTWNFGNDYWPGLSALQAKRLLQAALSMGIYQFDTAFAYGRGKSEQVLASQLRTIQHEQPAAPPFSALHIHSKAVLKSNRSISRDVEAALQRLRLPSLEAFFIHWPKSGVNPAPAVEALNTLKARGLIRHVGVSNFPPSLLTEALKGGPIDLCQFGYNLLWRFADEALIPLCAEHRIQCIAYSPLAQGLLSGRPLPNRPREESPARKFASVLFYDPVLWPRLQPILAEMQRVTTPPSAAAEAGKNDRCRLASAALSWVLSKPMGSLPPKCIVGASSPEQLQCTVGALSRPPENGLLKTLEDLSLTAWKAVRSRFPHADNFFNHRY